MSDSYKAIFDAIRNENIGHYFQMMLAEAQYVAGAQQAPSVLYRPALSIDGDQWCALYGDNLQDGVAGFGDSPDLAMQDFNRNWAAKLKPRATSQEQAK